MARATIVKEEAERFGRLASDWWDPNGRSAMLHKLNPVRLTYIRDQVERALEVLDRRHSIVDVEPLPRRMLAGGLNKLGCGIDRRDLGAQSRQRLGQQPCPASDIQRSLSSERTAAVLVERPMLVDPVTDIAQPHRIELMQHRRRALRVPPVTGELPELLNLFLNDACFRHIASVDAPTRDCISGEVP